MSRLRPVLLAPSPWSETSIATAIRLAEAGFPLAGAVALRSWDVATLMRKARQWGPRAVLAYALRKLVPARGGAGVRNSALAPLLEIAGRRVRTLHEAGKRLDFPVRVVSDINSPAAVERVRSWAPDLIVYTGGGLVRPRLLAAARIGVLNSHAGPLPEIRGMSAPEWTLLAGLPPAVTVHLMDEGVDTGPIVLRRDLPMRDRPASLEELRDRLAALGVTLKVEAVRLLADAEFEPRSQVDDGRDLQHFVMHEALARVAARRLARPESAETVRAGA